MSSRVGKRGVGSSSVEIETYECSVNVGEVEMQRFWGPCAFFCLFWSFFGKTPQPEKKGQEVDIPGGWISNRILVMESIDQSNRPDRKASKEIMIKGVWQDTGAKATVYVSVQYYTALAMSPVK